MKRSPIPIILLLVLALITLSAFLIQYRTPRASTNILNRFDKNQALGGFNIDTPDQAVKASTDGIQVAFQYGNPPSDKDKLGQKLHYLYYYECHRTHTVKLAASGDVNPCTTDSHPELNSENALLANIANHLQQEKNNPLIIGYWVLDDWVSWDAGSARQLLIKIHDLIQQYTPGRPAICGFGGSIDPYLEYGWHDEIADNFSPQGCDEVGLYIYASSQPDTTPVSSSDLYDWSMSGILPAMFASLQQRGWNINKEPLIGIGQAFGGPQAHTDRYWVTPGAKDIETQSRSFCEHGATRLAFYSWEDPGYGPTTQTPMSSAEVGTGIRNGIAACKAYWKQPPGRGIKRASGTYSFS